MRNETTIQKLNSLQKDILSEFAQKWNGKNNETTFRNDVKKLYGFEKEFGWNILLNSFYVIDDTELAKISFKQFELQGPSRHPDIGEKYLRLYGILNAIYQQKLAVENLLEIHKVSNKKELLKQLSESKIIELRNKIGAHSTNFKTGKEDSEHNFDVYEISRPKLDRDAISLLRNQNERENFALFKEIEIFDTIIESNLSLIVTKIIKKIYRNQGEFYKRLVEIEFIRNGGMIIGNTKIEFK